MHEQGLYIYGVVPNFYGTDTFRLLENSGVRAISYQNISAIVSDWEGTQVDFSDRESLAYVLVTHQKTIESLMELGFNMIIPMKLGTIAKTKEEVIEILTKGHELIINILKKIEYYTEIDLAVTWADFPSIIQEVAIDPDILGLKQSVLANGEATQADQMKIGMLINQKLINKNAITAVSIEEALAPITLSIKKHELMNDQMVANFALLLKRVQTAEFEQIIDKLDETFGGKLNFKIVGPLPCYSFYTLEVMELDPGLIEMAGQELGLPEELTEADLKKAYLRKAGLLHPDKNISDQNPDGFTLLTKSYKVLLDYALATRQSSKEKNISLVRDQIIENRVFVKIKD